MRILLIAYLAINASFVANAEQFLVPAAHIMCDEDAGFFELQTKQAPEISNYSDMHTIDTLERTPFSCDFKRHQIKVHGQNLVDGRGPCGAVHGEFVHVTINGLPLTAPIQSTTAYTSARSIRKNGTFDISGCFDRSISVTVREGESWFSTRVCHLEDDRNAGPHKITGECISEFHTGETSPFIGTD